MDIQPRAWYTLMAITAIKTGAKLPIIPSPKKHPYQGKPLVVKKRLDHAFCVTSLVVPYYKERGRGADNEEGEPTVFPSIIHSSF